MPTIPKSPSNSQSCWNTIGVKGDRTCPELTSVIHCRNCATYSQGGRQLLDREPPSGYQQEWTRLLAETTENTENIENTQGSIASHGTTNKQEIAGAENSLLVSKGNTLTNKVLSVVIFRLQKEWLALKASIFKEVTEPSIVRTLPHRSSDIFLGLVSIRGELQLCISLNHLLSLETGSATNSEVNSGVVAKTGAKIISAHSSLAISPTTSQTISPTTSQTISQITSQTNQSSQKVNPLIYKRLVVVEREGSLWVFPVDEIYGVQRFSVQDLHPAPVVVSKAAHSYTQGVFDWQTNQARYHVNYLDDELLFHTLNRRVL